MPIRTLIITLCLFMSFASTMILSGCASTPHRESTGQFVDDSAITVKVKSALLANDQIKSLAISVKTYKGIVEISGFVDTAAQKATAIDIARNVDGVKAVVNALVVKMH